MKNLLFVAAFALLLQSCQEQVKDVSSINPVIWSKRFVTHPLPDSLVHGKTYLSVYSQIYSLTQHTTIDLTATVSIRNMNQTDSVYIHSAEYFNTHGHSIRTYFDKTIYIAPMETVEIVIDELDKEGGTGANFLFSWSIRPHINEPNFEGIMISTSGQQGLSFTTQGHRLK
jgi:hypothetical protein